MSAESPSSSGAGAAGGLLQQKAPLDDILQLFDAVPGKQMLAGSGDQYQCLQPNDLDPIAYSSGSSTVDQLLQPSCPPRVGAPLPANARILLQHRTCASLGVLRLAFEVIVLSPARISDPHDEAQHLARKIISRFCPEL